MKFRIVFGALLISSAAAAQDAPRLDNRARAQQLFDSALSEAQKGDFAHACPKFLASQEADPKASTLLNLANCYEKNGQTASAWGAYREAEGLARKTNHADWETQARTHAESLEPKLIRLTITVPEPSRVPGLAVTRDGARLANGEYGVAIPVDPGEHVIGASADGYISVEKKLPVKDGDATFDLPALEKLPPPPAEPGPPALVIPKGFPDPNKSPDKKKWSTPEIAGVTMAGVGAAALATGGIFALIAAGNYQDAKSHCSDGDVHGCPANAVTTADTAYHNANIATAFFVTGAVLLVAGGLLVWLSPSETKLAKAPSHVFTW